METNLFFALELPLLVGMMGVTGGSAVVGEGVSTEIRLASWHGDPSLESSFSSSMVGALRFRLYRHDVRFSPETCLETGHLQVWVAVGA